VSLGRNGTLKVGHFRDEFDAVIIDDSGHVQQSREEMEVLFTLLAERYVRGRAMLTSNLPCSKWETIFMIFW
jgi:DNA replication protein DnaC